MNLIKSFLLVFIFILLSCFPAKNLTGKNLPLTINEKTLVDNVEVTDLFYPSGDLRIRGRLFINTGNKNKVSPAIIYNHGGVEGLSKNAAKRCIDLAKEGFIVFAPSYRGQDGSDGEVEVAKGEVDDVIVAFDILSKHPLIDPQRIGMLGTSHGALITVLALARNPKVEAAVEAYGVMDINNWYSYLVENNFDVEDELSQKVYGKGPEHKPEAFRVRNAILVADKIKTPLFIVHGAKDKIVPKEQAQELVNALRQNGNQDFEYRIYPNLGHGFLHWNDFDKHTPEELKEAEEAWGDILGFFEKHLR